ncbi:DUF3817 domain-containing protein [Flavobacterium agricola]|uniref:DUF3817 domain-containing protein n=1 Tax=Flavobacterium agricola TaxID=2870839 RepID=A0ABY6M0P8_9FLAO|nr:DUF3817 domain-containing protein [Flavobacterium agricola]UYW02134.1 DUF3817 domain-containing protein [Flavobacterium agricola]
MLKQFKIIAFLEGISWILLFYNMFINKYFFPDMYQTLLKPFGWIHGLFFIVYIVLAVLLIKPQKWSFKDVALIFLASLLPFATFWVEYKYCKNA